MRIRNLGFALATAALSCIAAFANAAPATPEPPLTTAISSSLHARLESRIAEWRATRPKAKAALTRSRLVSALRMEGRLTRLDDIVSRLDKQLTTRRLTSVQVAELAQQLQSEEDKLKEEIKKAREEAKTGFEDADERVNQLLNILIGITRTMNEMRAGDCKGCL